MISGFAGEHFILFYFKKFLLLGKTPLIRTFYNSNFFLGPLAIRIIEVRLYYFYFEPQGKWVGRAH